MSKEKQTLEKTKPGNDFLAGVGRSVAEIENRINEIKDERQRLLKNYLKSNDEKERDIISLIATEKALTIKELQWVLGL